MSQIGDLTVRIGADSSDLVRGINQAKSSVDGFESSVLSLTGVLKGLFAGLSVAAFTQFIRGTINAADELGKLSQKLGIGTEELSKLQYAADLAGVSSGELSASLSRLTKGMSDAAQGTGEAIKGFQALGINVKNSDNTLRSSSEVMGDIADRFANIEDGAGKTALAIAIFGRSGANMIPLLNGGRNAIREAGDELSRFGGVVTSDAARKAEIFNDNMTRMNVVVKAVGISIANELLPVLTKMSQEFLVAEKNSLTFFDKLQLGLRSPFKNYQQLIRDIDKELASLGDKNSIRFDADRAASLQRQKAYYKEMAQIQALAGANEQYSDAISRRFTKPEQKEKAPTITDDKLAEAERKQLEDRLKAVQRSLMTETELAKASYDERLKILQEAKAKGLEIEGGYDKAVEDLKTQHQQRLLEIEATSPEALAAKKAEEELNLLQEKLTALQELFLTEEEAYMLKYERQLQMLRESMLNELLTIEEFNALKADAEKKYGDEIKKIREKNMTDIERFTAMSYKKQAQTIFAELSNISAGVSSNNKTLFELNKAAGVANAIVNAYEGISRTMAKYPYPINIGLAAAHAAAAFAQVQAISSQSFNGGSRAAPSLAGGTAATPVSPVSGGVPGEAGAAFGGGQVVSINLQGEVFGREQVRGLIGQINEAISDGAVLRVQ